MVMLTHKEVEYILSMIKETEYKRLAVAVKIVEKLENILTLQKNQEVDDE